MKKHNQELLLCDDGPEELELDHGLPRARRNETCRISRLVLIALFSFMFGVVMGRWLPIADLNITTDFDLVLPAPSGPTAQVWQLNETFANQPSEETEAAWASLIPLGRGFIHHEEIAPFVSNIAVFHQLHCLHGLLVSFYALEAKAEYLEQRTAAGEESAGTTQSENSNRGGGGGTSFSFNAFGEHTDSHHNKHCFDYLRRSLMCHADTNLEVLDSNFTTNGWGQRKYCRDYKTVYRFAEKWRNSSDEGIAT